VGKASGMIAAIGAVASNGMLGLDGWLPWDIPEELAYFETTVAGAALVIGRLTYESMDVVPRDSFVVTRQLDRPLRPGCTAVASVEAGLAGALGDRQTCLCDRWCINLCRCLALLPPFLFDAD